MPTTRADGRIDQRKGEKILSGKNLVLLEVGGIIAGAFFGAILHAYFSGVLTEKPFLVTACVFVAILLVLIAAICILNVRIKEIPADVKGHFESIDVLLTELKGRIGVKVTFLDVIGAFLDARDEVKKAKREILAVTNWTQPYNPNPSALAEGKDFFDTILREVGTRHIQYERLIQLPSAGKRAVTLNELIVSHVQACIKARESGMSNIKVHKCHSSVSLNFLVIDERVVFFQIDEFNEYTHCYQFSKCLKLEDDTGEMASVFSRMYHDFGSKAEFSSVQYRDL